MMKICFYLIATMFALLFEPPVDAAGPVTANPILFVTQVPQPNEANNNVITNVFLGVGAGFGNHLGTTLSAPRGGDLWLRKTDGTLTNLTRGLGFGQAGAQHGGGIAVREPSVHWDGTRALFSMVVGAPADPSDKTIFFWQLYELTGLPNGPYGITKVPGQPANYNNVSPCYTPDGKIIFSTDRPRDGSPHLYPQLDEYNEYPTVTGLWTLDPAAGDYHILNHTPSGAFTPFVDSFGRVLLIRWDHLVQDRNATDDRLGLANNGTFNYADESASASFNLNDRVEFFPEPRTFDSTNLAALKVNGNAFNTFFPWTMFLDGTGEELLNHLGRHDLLQSFRRSFTNDTALVDFSLAGSSRTTFLNNFFWVREDPKNPGVYFGIDSPDFGMHAAGQILTITAPPSLNADNCFITYITPKSTAAPNAVGAFRNPLPMSDGSLVAAFAAGTATIDTNIGTITAPRSKYPFRLYTLKKSGATWVADLPLTIGLSNNVSFYVDGQLTTYNGPLWEYNPVEVVARPAPPIINSSIDPVEQQVFQEEEVDVNLFRKYLQANNLSLVVSHNVTRRDRADKQQPYNLRIAGTTNVTIGNSGQIYDISHMQFIQADQRRGYTGGSSTPVPGRRALATPLHDPAADIVIDPAAPADGSVKLASDGSLAALLPARRAISHQLLGTNGQSIVKERYWITYQPGEIRTCKVCHGINTADQAGNPPPENKPEALRELLRYWKSENIPQVGIRNESGTNYLALTFKRRPAVMNLTYNVEISADLNTWITGNQYKGATILDGTNTIEVSRSGSPTETITVRDLEPLEENKTRFIRVRILPD